MKIIPVIFTLISASLVYGQERFKAPIKLKISGFEIGRTGYFGGDQSIDWQNASKIALNNNFADLGLAGHSVSYSGNAFRNSGATFAGTFNLVRSDGSKMWGNPALRIGFSYHTGYYDFSFYSKNDVFSHDSVAYTLQGNTTYLTVDSVYANSHRFGIRYDRFRINGGLLWRTNQEKKWSFYGGVGFGLGVSLNTTVAHSEQTQNVFKFRNSENNLSYWTNELLPESTISNINSVFRGKNILDMTISVPLGLDLRLGNQCGFLRHVHWFGEVAPVFTITKYSRLAAFYNIGYSGTTGIRVKF